MKANLHIHSKNSDGTKSIKEINELALKYNFDYIAITDHDTINAVDEINILDTTINYIIGVEMSVKYKNEEIHILGYFKNKKIDTVKDYFNKVNAKRINRAKKIIENLKKYYNIDISLDDVKKKADGVIARPHISEVICEKYGYTFNEVFDKFLGDDKKAYVPYELIELKDAIKYLKDNDALVVLAHPILIKKFDFKEILDFGFDGIEVYHPDQNKEYQEILIKLAKENNLIITGGSDYHGEIITNKFEESYIENNDLNIFLNKLK